MTGPEHYREAERLTNSLRRYTDASDALVIATMAQVHATLALAAATALVATEERPRVDRHAWWLAAGTKPPKDDD